MLSKRCVSTTHHGVLIYTPQKHTLSCVILRTKGVLGEHTMGAHFLGTHLFLQCKDGKGEWKCGILPVACIPQNMQW